MLVPEIAAPRLSLALAIAAIALSACGGDDEEDSGAFADRVNAVCDDYRRSLGALPPPETRDASADFDARAARLDNEVIDELHGLEPPEEAQVDYEEYVSAHEDALELVARIRAATTEGDPGTAKHLQDEAGPAVERLDQLAGELGFTSCAGTSA